MADILARSRWTSTQKGFPRLGARRRLTPSKVTRLTPHYPAAGDVTFANPTLAQSAQRLRNWRNFHVGTHRWADIGYNFAIDQNGRIFDCAGRTHAAAHAGGHNFTAIGVLFIVGNNERPSAAARAAFRALGRHLREKNFPNMSITPVDHGRLSGESTSCSGTPIRRDIDNKVLNFPGTKNTGSTKSSQYTVRAGDTLSHIAGRFNVSVSALASANDIRNRNLIRVGQVLDIPGSGSSSSGSGGSGGSTSSGSSSDGTRANETSWPGSRLPQIFTARSNPFQNASGTARDEWFNVVPARYSAALYEAIRRAGFSASNGSESKWGHEELIGNWLRARYPSLVRNPTVRSLGNSGAFGNPASIWAAFQLFLRARNLYSGRIDGHPGAGTWWGTVQWLNGSMRKAYL